MLIVPCIHEVGFSRHPWSISPGFLRRELLSLKKTGYRFISIDQIDLALASPEELFCLVTFDDGRRGIWMHALPILAELEISALFYLCTDFIGGRMTSAQESYSEFISWDQAREVIKRGHAVGSHSTTHRVLLGLSEQDVEVELRGSKLEIEAQLGVPCLHFAAPYGAINQRGVELGRAIGYETFAVGEGIAQHRSFIRRIGVQEGASVQAVVRRLLQDQQSSCVVVGRETASDSIDVESFRVLSRFRALRCGCEWIDTLGGLLPIPVNECKPESGRIAFDRDLFSDLEAPETDRSAALLISRKSGTEYLIRLADFDEAERINRLFNRCFSTSRSVAEWRWKFEARSSLAKPPLVVAENRGELVGAYLASPYVLAFGGDKLLGAQVVDNCILPEHRSRGLQRLMWARFTHSLFDAWDLGFGFPGERASKIGRMQLSYEEVESFAEYCLPLLGEIRDNPQYRFAAIDQYNDTHEAFFVSQMSSSAVAVVRSAEYLNWRYYQAPADRFESIEIGDSDGDLVGVGVFRLEGEQASVYELACNQKKITPDDLLAALSSYWAPRGICRLRTRITSSHPTAALFLAMGAKAEFSLQTSVVFLPVTERARALRRADWHLILGDSDLR